MVDLPAFTYSRPRTLAAALAALARPGACIYAGGTDLLVALAERRPWVRFVREVVDIKDVPEAQGVTECGTRLRIGALATAAELASHRLVRRHARVLAEAAAQTSSPALRQRGTVGGNVSTPHPAGDVVTALLALDATVEVAEGTAGREMSLADFMRAQARHWPRQNLILTVSIRKCRRSAFEKVGARAAFSRSVVAVGVAEMDNQLRVALGGLRERPFLSSRVAESVGDNRSLATALAAECCPPADALASESYRFGLAETLLRRAVARVERR